MPTNWRVYGSDTIAAVLDKAELPGFWRRITVGPNECALVIRNGKIEEAITQERVSTSGALDRLAGLFGRASDVQVIFVDTTPFDLTFYLGDSVREEAAGGLLSSESSGYGSAGSAGLAETREAVYEALRSRSQSETDTSRVVIQALSIDSQPITAEVRLTVSVELEDADLLSGLLRDKAALATWDLAALIRDELLARVIVPKVARCRADELRGNSQLSSEINQTAEQELKTTFGLWGLTLGNFFINWGLTEQEEHEIREARARREEEATEFAHQRAVKDMERGVDIDRTRLGNLQELKVLEAQGKEELQEVYLAAELNRDNLVEGQRINVAKVDAQIQTLVLDVQRQDANLSLEVERARADQRLDAQRREAQARQEELEAERCRDISEMEQLVNLQSRMQNEKHLRELELHRLRIGEEFGRNKQANESQFAARRQQHEETMARMAVTERLVAQGLQTGAVDAQTMRTMLEQSTEQEYAHTTDAMVESRSQAQAARYNVEGIHEEQERERAHQAEITRIASDMMEASKQPPAGQAAPLATPPQQPPPPAGPTVNVTNVTATPQTTGLCPSCSNPTQPSWKACPRCGASLVTTLTCTNCGMETQHSWKNCPGCGTQL